jgi:hypothetical protein
MAEQTTQPLFSFVFTQQQQQQQPPQLLTQQSQSQPTLQQQLFVPTPSRRKSSGDDAMLVDWAQKPSSSESVAASVKSIPVVRNHGPIISSSASAILGTSSAASAYDSDVDDDEHHDLNDSHHHHHHRPTLDEKSHKSSMSVAPGSLSSSTLLQPAAAAAAAVQQEQRGSLFEQTKNSYVRAWTKTNSGDVDFDHDDDEDDDDDHDHLSVIVTDDEESVNEVDFQQTQKDRLTPERLHEHNLSSSDDDGGDPEVWDPFNIKQAPSSSKSLKSQQASAAATSTPLPPASSSSVASTPILRGVMLDSKPWRKRGQVESQHPPRLMAPMPGLDPSGITATTTTIAAAANSATAPPTSDATAIKPIKSSSMDAGGVYDDSDASSSSASTSASSCSDSMDFSAAESDEDYRRTDMMIMAGENAVLDEIDFDGMEQLPTKFTDSNVMNMWLDSSAVENGITQPEAQQFCWEHHLFLRAILQLLAERDHTVGNVEDSVVLKKGPLKKSSLSSVGRPVWKVKYVELRKGSFSYFEDEVNVVKKDKFGHKVIPLRGSFSCEPISNKQMKGMLAVPGFPFELSVEGAPTRYWLANSEAERLAWIKAILNAGEEKSDVDLSQYTNALAVYQAVQAKLRLAKTQPEYLIGMNMVFEEPLQIPVKWVRDHVEGINSSNGAGSARDESTRHATEHHHRPDKSVRSSIAEFWKSLSLSPVSINGTLVESDTEFRVERIVGALTRAVLEYDRSAEDESSANGKMGREIISELQAVSFARSILMSVVSSKSRDEGHFALENLCRNTNLVVVLPDEASINHPLYLRVSYATDDPAELDATFADEMSGWVSTRSKAYNSLKQRYCVISEGVLNYYEQAKPRPHGLRGQIPLAGASLSVIEGKSREDANLHILLIKTSDEEKERQLAFQKKSDMLEWKEAIQGAIEACSMDVSIGASNRSIRKKMIGGGRIIKGAKNEGAKLFKGATGSGFKVIKGASDLMFRGSIILTGGQIMKASAASPDNRQHHPRTASSDFDQEMCITTSCRSEPTVQVVVEAPTDFKIITSDPSGDESKDIWV